MRRGPSRSRWPMTSGFPSRPRCACWTRTPEPGHDAGVPGRRSRRDRGAAAAGRAPAPKEGLVTGPATCPPRGPGGITQAHRQLTRGKPPVPPPPQVRTHRLTVIAQDPSVKADGRILTAEVDVPAEELRPGP